MKIFIPVMCRNEEHLESSLLIFKTLRIGFPSFDVEVHIDYDSICKSQIIDELGKNNLRYIITPEHFSTYKWTEELIREEQDPFIILDTDVIFYENCEGIGFYSTLMGCLIPEFFDPYTEAWTQPRLHNSFLYINPAKFCAYANRIVELEYVPVASLIKPLLIPSKLKSIFYDTLAIAYNIMYCQVFPETVLDKYCHLHCGSLLNTVGESFLPEVNLKEVHKQVCANPALGKGMWRQQKEWYKQQTNDYMIIGQEVLIKNKKHNEVVGGRFIDDGKRLRITSGSHNGEVLFRSQFEVLEKVEKGESSFSLLGLVWDN